MTRKEELRKILKAALRKKFAQTSPDEILRLSLAALTNLLTIPVLPAAETAMLYLEMPREFPVTPLILPLLDHSARRIVIPWCEGDHLRPFRLVSAGEAKNQNDLDLLCSERLAPGAYGILEPREELRLRPEFQVEPIQIDLVIVPGLGFDRSCRRLGRGKGYYDRFISTLRPDVPLIGICFDEQIVECVPTEPHDRALDDVVTPTQLYAAEPNTANLPFREVPVLSPPRPPIEDRNASEERNDEKN